MMKDKSVMILGASELQIPAIKASKALGFKVIAVDYNPEAIGFSLADVSLIISTVDKEKVLAAARKYQPDYIFTSTSDAPVRTAAYVNEVLNREPDITYENSICATDKSKMRERLKQNNIPIPGYYVTNSFEEFVSAIGNFSDKCVIKPADNAGSRGVILYDVQKDADLKELYEYSKNYSKNGIVLVEEYIYGNEISVEAITVNHETTIIAMTDKNITPIPFFVETGHSEPAMMKKELENEVKDIVRRTINAIGIINGPSHTEIKLAPSGPKVIETAARLGGDFITSELVPLSTGIDLVEQSIRLATHNKVNLERKLYRGSAIRFIIAQEGTIESIDIDEKINAMEGVVKLVIYKKCGDKINVLRSSNDRIGYVIASGEDVQSAIDIAEKAISYINIKIK